LIQQAQIRYPVSVFVNQQASAALCNHLSAIAQRQVCPQPRTVRHDSCFA
jgi:hypothetical protein